MASIPQASKPAAALTPSSTPATEVASAQPEILLLLLLFLLRDRLPRPQYRPQWQLILSPRKFASA